MMGWIFSSSFDYIGSTNWLFYTGHETSKITITFEPLMRFWCTSRPKISSYFVRKSILLVEASSLYVWAWLKCQEVRWADFGFGIVSTKDPNKLGFNQTGGQREFRPQRKNCVIHTILHIRTESFCPPPYYAVWNHHLLITL